MKIKILMMAALIPAFAAAQAPNFTISGKIGNLNKPAMIYLDYMDNGASHEDSTALVNGSFKFTGYTSDIAGARMALGHTADGKQYAIYRGGDMVLLYFGPGNLTINSEDSLSNAKFTGSKVYDEYAAYNKLIGGSPVDMTKAANAEFSSGTPEQQRDTNFIKVVDKHFRARLTKRTEMQLQYAKDHPDSYFGLVALSEAAGAKVDVNKVAPIYNALNEKLRKTDIGQELAQRIKAASTIAVGNPAPLFTQNDVNGKPVSLADLKGKVVLVDFWASWCHPCRGENPNLVKQYKLYKDKGFEIISVSLDNVKKNWVNAIAQDGLTWLQVCDLKGWNNEVGRLYGIREVPTSFLIDGDGKIIANNPRGEVLNQKLAEIFK